MSAEAIGKRGNIAVVRTSTDSGGRFEFTEVPPGRYVVGVDLIRRTDAKEIFPTTFHPGTQDASGATIVQLEGGQERELEPMTPPRARHSHWLLGTVVFEDGTPASGGFISLPDGIARFRQVAVGIRRTRRSSDCSFTRVFQLHRRASSGMKASEKKVAGDRWAIRHRWRGTLRVVAGERAIQKRGDPLQSGGTGRGTGPRAGGRLSLSRSDSSQLTVTPCRQLRAWPISPRRRRALSD